MFRDKKVNKKVKNVLVNVRMFLFMMLFFCVARTASQSSCMLPRQAVQNMSKLPACHDEAHRHVPPVVTRHIQVISAIPKITDIKTNFVAAFF